MRGGGRLWESSFNAWRVCAGMTSVTGFSLRTKAGDVSVQSDIFEVPLGCLHLCGVALRHVIHGKHGFLTELSVVVKVDLSIKANHWRDGEMTKAELGIKTAAEDALKVRKGERAGEGKGKRRRTPDIKSQLIIISKT